MPHGIIQYTQWAQRTGPTHGTPRTGIPCLCYYETLPRTLMNMFKATPAKTVEEYLAAVPSERQEMVRFLHAFIQKATPSLRPHFAANMLGYGSFPYKNAKKEMVEWPVIALANQKQYVSLYVCSVVDGKYLAETHRKELGKKVSVGKSCIRFTRLEDVDLDALKKVLKLAEKHPGLVGVGASARK